MTKGRRRMHTKSFSSKQTAEAAVAAEWQPKVAAQMMLRGSLVSRNIIANVAYERRFYFIQKGSPDDIDVASTPTPVRTATTVQ